jgi:hypothetical protein
LRLNPLQIVCAARALGCLLSGGLGSLHVHLPVELGTIMHGSCITPFLIAKNGVPALIGCISMSSNHVVRKYRIIVSMSPNSHGHTRPDPYSYVRSTKIIPSLSYAI